MLKIQHQYIQCTGIIIATIKVPNKLKRQGESHIITEVDNNLNFTPHLIVKTKFLFYKNSFPLWLISSYWCYVSFTSQFTNISNIQDAHQYTRCVNLGFHTHFNKPYYEHRICASRFSSDGIKMVLWERIQRKNIQMGRLEPTSSASVWLHTSQQILHRNRCSVFKQISNFVCPPRFSTICYCHFLAAASTTG